MSLRISGATIYVIYYIFPAALLIDLPDLPVLFQQHPHEHERPLSGMSATIRRQDDPVENGHSGRVS